jgi:hypothetical protein
MCPEGSPAGRPQGHEVINGRTSRNHMAMFTGDERATKSPSPGTGKTAHDRIVRDASHPGVLRRILGFFDSTTKVLVALGGLIAAALGLWTAVSQVTSAQSATRPPAAVASGRPQFVIQPESCGALSYGEDGTAGPVLCPDGRPNLAADRWYRKYHLRVLELGPDASPAAVINAICADFSAGPPTHTSNPIESDAASLAQTEEQWHFLAICSVLSSRRLRV